MTVPAVIRAPLPAPAMFSISTAWNSVGKQAESFGQQRVPGENRGCLAIHLVIGRTATTEIIIIHGRQVIVDQ